MEFGFEVERCLYVKILKNKAQGVYVVFWRFALQNCTERNVSLIARNLPMCFINKCINSVNLLPNIPLDYQKMFIVSILPQGYTVFFGPKVDR